MDRQELKLGARILENLPVMSSDVMQGWIDNPKALGKFLMGLNPPDVVVSAELPLVFPVWKTVKLGTNLKTADDFRSAIKQVKMKISDWGNDILGKPAFTVSETEMDVDLVNVSVADLGFKDGAYRRDIIAKALSLGLELCPAEVGPQLRLEYRDQPKGEWLLIGMEPITDSDGGLGVFYVAHGHGERWLDGGNGHPGVFWFAGHRFVFVRPSK